MAARKRGTSETFKRYRKNLKKEENALKRKLLGRVLWPDYMGTAMRYTLDGKRWLAGKGKVGGYKFSAYSCCCRVVCIVSSACVIGAALILIQ